MRIALWVCNKTDAAAWAFVEKCCHNSADADKILLRKAAVQKGRCVRFVPRLQRRIRRHHAIVHSFCQEPLLNFHCLRFQEHTCMHPFPTIYMFRNLKYQVIATIPFLDYGRQNQVNSLQYARSIMIFLKPFSLFSVAL